MLSTLSNTRRRQALVAFLGIVLLILVGVGKKFFQTDLITVYVTKLPSGMLFFSEDPAHPDLRRLRKEEGLDRLIEGAATEFERLERLVLWTSKQFAAGSPFKRYPPWNARVILSEIRQGRTEGFCAQYAFVFGQACQSFGYAVRYTSISRADLQDGHAVTEVYLPAEKRWVVFDPQNGGWYGDAAGHPLSILEIHTQTISAQGADIYRWPKKTRLDRDWRRRFEDIRFNLRNNFLSTPVFIAQIKTPKGTAIGFCPYTLRWTRRVSPLKRGMFRSLLTTNSKDFEFSIDLTHASKTVHVQSLEDFAPLAQAMSAQETVRVRASEALWISFVRDVLIQDGRFELMPAPLEMS